MKRLQIPLVQKGLDLTAAPDRYRNKIAAAIL
jgi:hypothetical protein